MAFLALVNNRKGPLAITRIELLSLQSKEVNVKKQF